MSWHCWSFLFLWLAIPLHVAGQSSNVTNCVASYDWSINSLGQTPCLVAAYLESLCGVPTMVSSIPNGTHYLGPTSPSQQDPCKCSTVTYSVVSACGGCQGRTYQNWTTWSQFCDNVEIATFPQVIPTEVQVPAWAYVNITSIGDNFDPTFAQRVNAGGLPSSSLSAPIATGPSSTQPTSISSSSATSSSSVGTTPATSSKSHSNAGAIAGGVTAGLVVLAALCLFFLWRFVSKKRNAVQTDFTFDSRALVSGHTTGGTLMTQTTGTASRSPYNYGPSPASFSQSHQHASDMNAFPLSPATTTAYTSPPPASRRSLESVSASMAQFGGYQTQTTAQPGYSGAAEV